MKLYGEVEGKDGREKVGIAESLRMSCRQAAFQGSEVREY